jgi:aminopeptidase N
VAENNLLRSEAADRARLLDDLHYDVTLDLTGEETFRSETRLRCRGGEAGAETFLDLTAVRLESATVNGAPVAAGAFDADAGRLRVGGLAAENEIVVVADHAYEHTGVGLHRFVDPVDGAVYLHTQFEPFDAHRVFPCFDQPDLKATFTFEVEAPAGWEVVSNGTATDRPADGAAGRWRFATTEKMSTYITALVAGPFHSTHRSHRPGGAGVSPERTIDMGLYCRQSLAQYLDADEIFDITAAGFDFFEDAFGQPYVFGKYDQLFVPEFNFGAMENAGCVTFSERHIFRSKVTEAEREGRADTILHEMAHMWFGDLVTMRWWDDLWLNESFATFASYLALVEATRFRSGWTTFGSNLKTWAYRQDQLPSTHPIVADAPDVETMKTNFDGITYAKGASVLRQLVAWVGQKEFLDGIRNYFAHHAWGNTELCDFLSALEEASGRQLGEWAQQWLETTGVNTLRAAFEGTDTYASFALEQEAVPDHPMLRSHRVAVGLYDYDEGHRLRRRDRVELDVEGHRTAVEDLVGVRVPDLLLINDGDLAYTKIRLDPRSLTTLTESLGTLDDSLARSLCWSAAWDMLRDAELPARRYLKLVLANLAGEDEIAVVAGLLRNAEAAAIVFGDPANREPARRRLADHALDALRSSAPGSDVQLAYARAFATAARSDDHLALVRGLLGGSGIDGIDGLAIDTELRWALVRSLAAAGVEDAPALIAAEEERDATDAGARHAGAARAAQPHAAPKAEAWSALVDGDLPLAMMRAMMGGFRQPDQEPLLQGWTALYFDALLPVWERRGPDVGMSFTEMLYPVGDGAVTMTDEYLSRVTPLPAPIRRLLLEGRDQALRTARARACDAGAA